MAEGRTVPAGQWAGGRPASCVPSSRPPGEEVQVPLVQDLVLEGQKQGPGVSRLSGRWAGLGAGQGGHCGVDLDHPLWGPSGLNKGTGTWPGLRLPFTALPGYPPRSRSAARGLAGSTCPRLCGLLGPGPRRRASQRLPGLEPAAAAGRGLRQLPAWHERSSPSRLLAERTQWAGEDPGQQSPSRLRPSPRPAAPGSDPGQRFPSGLVCPHAWLSASCQLLWGLSRWIRGPSPWPGTNAPTRWQAGSPVGTELQALAVCWAHGGSRRDFLDLRSGCGRGGRGCGRSRFSAALLLCGPGQGTDQAVTTALSGSLVASGVRRVTWLCLDPRLW